MSRPHQSTFLTVRVEEVGPLVSLLGLCAGFEDGQWRSKQFAKYLIENLCEFIFPYSEWGKIDSSTASRMLSTAATSVYTTGKYENRGEIGELILFTVMRHHYKGLPIISKMYFKTSSNDTVKGFDGVYFIENSGDLELWLGEVKFYSDLTKAIYDVCIELENHFQIDYLRNEFIWIGNKLEETCPHYEDICHLLSEKTSLDEIFPSVHVPVLLTYESATVAAHSSSNKDYLKQVEAEMRAGLSKFIDKHNNTKIIIHLILVPLGKKTDLQEAFDSRLKALQDL